MLVLGLSIGIGLYLLYALTKCYVRVNEGHLAVLTTFGAAHFVDHEAGTLKTLGPGLHFKLPWQHAIVVPMMEQNLDLAGEDGGRTAMADDGTILRFDSIMRYHPVEKELAKFVFGLRAPLEHMTGLFTCLLRNEIANFRLSPESQRAMNPRGHFDFVTQGGSYALIRRERQRLNRQIEEFCQERIGNRYGVQFNAVDLVDILPPDELAAALNAVINAQTEAEARYFRAEGDCQQRILAAEQGVDIAKTRARAVEIEITRLGSFLQDLATAGTLSDYVTRRRAEVLAESRSLVVKEAS